MNNQFATQFLLQEDVYDTLKSELYDLGADEDAVDMLVHAIELKLLTPSQVIKIVQDTVKGLGEMSSVGGGATNGASFSSGPGEQYAAGTRKKVEEDAPRLAAGKADISTYKKDGFSNAPSKQNRSSKAIDYKQMWQEALNESRGYNQFKREAATRSKPEQMHQAAKMIHNKLEEITKLLEFTDQMRNDLSEGDDTVEYKHNTKKVFEKINSKVVEVYSRIKKIK